MKLDAFTSRRLTRFIGAHREGSGQLPTLKDLAAAGFEKSVVEAALKDGVIEEFYVTLTSGTIVKGYKVREP